MATTESAPLAERRDLSLNRDLVDRISETLDEPEYMRERRREAFEHFRKLPVPSGENSEAWRRTDVTDLDFDVLRAGDGSDLRDGELPESLRELRDADVDRAGLRLEHNTAEAAHELDPDLADRGVVLCSLSEAVREYPDVVRDHFMEALPVDQNKFTALHAAFWTGGTFLYVPRDVEIERPVELHGYVDRDGLSLLDHTLIVVGPNSRVNVVESHRSADDLETRAISDGAAEIFVRDGAAVDYSHVQDLAPNYYDVSNRRGVCDSNARLNWITGILGSTKVKTTAITDLNGEGSETFLYGVSMATRGQHVDSDVTTVHRAPYTTDEMLSRGVVMEEATGVFRGIIEMKDGCRKAKGSLHERALMVGDDAEADAVPQMNVDENDVKAAHSASVGEMDEKQMLYMQSRGIRPERARRLIIHGFFEPILEKLPLQRVRDELIDLIDRKLDAADV